MERLDILLDPCFVALNMCCADNQGRFLCGSNQWGLGRLKLAALIIAYCGFPVALAALVVPSPWRFTRRDVVTTKPARQTACLVTNSSPVRLTRWYAQTAKGEARSLPSVDATEHIYDRFRILGG